MYARLTTFSVGQFVVHTCDSRECGQFVLIVPEKFGSVFAGKRMLGTRITGTSVLYFAPHFSVPAEVLECALFCLGVSVKHRWPIWSRLVGWVCLPATHYFSWSLTVRIYTSALN
jgi:hypothetical protein